MRGDDGKAGPGPGRSTGCHGGYEQRFQLLQAAKLGISENPSIALICLHLLQDLSSFPLLAGGPSTHRALFLDDFNPYSGIGSGQQEPELLFGALGGIPVRRVFYRARY